MRLYSVCAILIKFQSLFLFLLISLVSPLAHSQLKECQVPLLLSATTDWYPYLYVNGEGNSTGADVELLKIILKQLNCELKVVHFPERRSIYELKKGNFDVGLGASLNQERAAQYYFSTQYRHEFNHFVFRANDSALFDVEKLQDIIALNKKIAINLAGWYGAEIEESKAENNNYIYSDTVSRRLKMLLFNRADVVIDDYNVLCSELTDSSNANQLAIHPLILYEAPIHFIFNKKNISATFVEQFNIVIETMRKDGRLAAHFIEYLPYNCNKSIEKN